MKVLVYPERLKEKIFICFTQSLVVCCFWLRYCQMCRKLPHFTECLFGQHCFLQRIIH